MDLDSTRNLRQLLDEAIQRSDRASAKAINLNVDAMRADQLALDAYDEASEATDEVARLRCLLEQELQQGNG